MEAAEAAASAAGAAAKDAALAASVAAAASAKDAAAAAVTAKEATDAAKDAAAAASAAALNAKQAAAAASAAALSAKEAAVRASAAALDAKEAAAVAATAAAAAMQASQKRRFADAVLYAEEAAPAAASAGQATGPINAEEAGRPAANAEVAANAGRPAAAAEVVATQASKKRKSAAVVLNYKVPAPATAAALQASNECKFQIIDVDQDPPGSGDVDDDAGSVDHIGRLPDAVLCSIVSLLPTKEGARTQVISRRWRPLWHSAPLNLVADEELNSNNHNLLDMISKILSVHPGPTRRFSVRLFNSYYHDKMKGWLSSQALDKLQEFELIPDHSFEFSSMICLLPSSVYRFAPTLRVAKFGGCRFSNSIVKLSLKFPCLKQLTVDRVTISEHAFQSMLSGCYALESLELKKISGLRRLCISSQTLKSVGFCSKWFIVPDPLQELVIEDAPCLERLLALDPQVGPRTIRVISAPKLNILGALSKSITELQLGTTVFQSMIAVGLTTKMHSVRVLVLEYPNLDIVVNFLKCFPCLERLYAFFQFRSRMCISNPREYDPPEPIECLELHLKEVLLRNYDGTVPLCINFAKFFVLNAKVLKEMKITLPYHRQYNWFANQHRLLRTEDRISQDARIELKCGTNVCFTDNMNTHDLSMADPFDVPYTGCKKCSGSPF